jgi:hypothetical protein
VAGPEAESARELHAHGDREEIRRRATVTALHLLRRFADHVDVPLPTQTNRTPA